MTVNYSDTPQENMADQTAHGTKVTFLGEEHAMSRLTENDVLNLRKRYEQGGVTQYQLADEYGVHQTTINLIVRRKKWKHI